MNKQHGNSTLITLVVLGIIVGSLSIMLASSYNNMVRNENGIEAIDRDMQNVHASIFAQMKQQGVAVDKYGSMVIEAINAAIQGRYGKNGSGAAMQWIQEQNPTIDPKMMEKLQVAIEVGYNRFEATQRTKIDRVRAYKDTVQSFPNNIVAGLFGFPRKPWDELERIVTSAKTKQDFGTGELSDPEIFKK